MLRANNLSDVLDASVSLANIGGAPKNSPAFTGNPTAPTPAANDNDTSIATTAFVTTAITGKADKSYVDSQNATQDVNIADKISHLGDTMTGQLGLPTRCSRRRPTRSLPETRRRRPRLPATMTRASRRPPSSSRPLTLPLLALQRRWASKSAR
jgi:hypothetical protein